AAQLVLGFLVDRRQKDDRDALGLVAPANDLGGLVTVHAGHVDVEQDDRELAFEEVAKRLFPRTGKDHLTEVLQHGRGREQVALIIVDQKHPRTIGLDLGGLLRLGWASDGDLSHRAVHAYSAASSGIGCAVAACASRDRATHTRRSASSSSMSTGFAM